MKNCWSASNYNCNPTADFDVRAWSSTKSSTHMCTSAKASASHSLLSKCPSRTSKYSPNNRQLRGQPCFTSYYHLKLEVTPLLAWLMRTVSLTYIASKHHKKRPSTSKSNNTCHNTSCGTISNTFLKSTKQQ